MKDWLHYTCGKQPLEKQRTQHYPSFCKDEFTVIRCSCSNKKNTKSLFVANERMQYALGRKTKLHVTNKTFIFSLVSPVSYFTAFQHISALFNIILNNKIINVYIKY